MIIEEVELMNIRSYEHALVRVPLGKTLFEGDIGSGKSTILMAIEFAFFGLGSETGSSLLRLGERKGEVRMKFTVDGDEYEVRRGLERKAGGVHQTDGYLTTPEEKLNLSPRELKEKILEVLQFNEAPDPKAQSLIYRYAIYTPQEEMKAILSMGPDLRLQTLRRAFRVEDYKTAVENASELGRQLRGDVRELGGIATGLERLKEQREELGREEAELETSLRSLKKEGLALESELASLKAGKERLRVQQVRLEGLRSELRVTERVKNEEDREIAGIVMEVEEVGMRVSKLKASVKAGRKRPPSRLSAGELKALEREAESKVRRLTALKAKVESKLGDYESIMDKGVCPVCDRPVEAHEFALRRNSKENDRRHISVELGKAEKEADKTRETRELVEEYEAQRKGASEWRSELARLGRELGSRRRSLLSAQKRRQRTGAELTELTQKLEKFDVVKSRLAEVDGKEAHLEGSLRENRDVIARSAERVRLSRERKVELSTEIDAKTKAQAQSAGLKDAEMWLGDYFVPTVQLIERSVLATINQEFDTLFQKWFTMLVSDTDKEVKIDEAFTPLVTQSGYEQDVRYLSGGERTSVALAYRLALNSMARRVSAGMKSNLLILDEPTDGFSREQLGNVREVLDDMGPPQVIIVSHDKELESFADQILRVDKAQGVSSVRGAAR